MPTIVKNPYCIDIDALDDKKPMKIFSLFRDIINHASNRGISYGEMSEWFKEPVLKTGDPKGPWVRIPLSPPLSLL